LLLAHEWELKWYWSYADRQGADVTCLLLACSDPKDSVLNYVPLCELSEGSWQPAAPVSDEQASTGTFMARCLLEEVGLTPEGAALGMPKRPDWRGKGYTAQQLHSLEEKSFQDWLLVCSYPSVAIALCCVRVSLHGWSV
jgi:hypothetical protein